MESTETVLQTASAVLNRKEKIDDLIEDEVHGLADLITARLQTEREFRKLQCLQAIGDPAPGLVQASKAAADARGKLQEASLKLGGYRMQRGALGASLVESYDRLSAEIPKHNARIVADFTLEWRMAVNAFGLALGRRVAIEALLGQQIQLPDPVALPAELGADMTTPSSVLDAITGAIQTISDLKIVAERPVDANVHYDRERIYRAISDRFGLEPGSLLCHASLDEGQLRQFVELGWARPVLDHEMEPGVALAAKRAAEIEKARREAEYADHEKRLHVAVPESQKRSILIPDPFEPSQADLDRAAERQRQIDGRSGNCA